MKKIFLILSSAALLLAGCAKTEDSPVVNTGDEVTITVEAGMPEVHTKAAADYDGNAVKANHWIMEVRDAQGQLFYRDVKTPDEGTLQQTFKVTLIKNQSYDLLFWADNNGAFYDTDDLTDVQLSDPSGYDGNIDARDAFTACKAYTAKASEKLTAELYRPFAQVNVITTDLETLWAQAATTGVQEETYMKFAPENFIAKVNVPTSFNVKTQLCGEVSTQKVVIKADESYKGYKSDNVTPQDHNNYALHINPATLFMDYIFASKGQKDVVDIDFEFVSNGEKISYAFTSIPVQANYRTNIKGQLFSFDTEWTVDIKPAWESPDYDVDIYETTIDNINALNQALASDEAKDAKEVVAEVTMPKDSDDEDVTFTYANDDQTVNITFKGELGTNKTITFKNDTGAEGPANLNITAPAGSKLVFANPMTHVVINGTSYDNVSGTFSANSLIIPEGVTVKKLSIAEGGLEIHGTVESAEVVEPKKVTVRACEGLSTEVYNALKDYIAEGFAGVEVSSGVWDIAAGENWSAYAAKEYNNVDEATKTITIASAAQLALLSNEVNGGKTYEDWTFLLANDIDMAGHIFTPIGRYEPDQKMFKGTFNGQNNNIKNIEVSTKDQKGVGVFGKVYAPCVIKNLNVIGATVTAEGTNTYTGGLVGHGYATIENCTFKGNVHGGNQVAGIAASGGFTIKNCTFDGNIYGKYWGIGGIVGNCQDGSPISGNTAKGSIIANLDTTNPLAAGGIIGCAIYTSTQVKDNYSAMKITFNGEAQTDYPIMGLYNIDDETIAETPDLCKMDNLLTTVAGNKWDKNIYLESAYTIYYNTEAPQCAYMFMNYGAATTRWPVAVINGVEYTSMEDALSAAESGDEIQIVSPVSTISIPASIAENITIKGSEGVNVQHFALAADATYKNLTICDFSGCYPGTDKNFVSIPSGTVVENMLFTNVSLTSVSEKGNWTTAVRLEGGESKEISFQKCNFDGVQYSVYSPSSTGKSLYFDDCDFKNTSSWAIQTNGGGAADSVAVVNCRFDNCKGLVKTNTTSKFIFKNNTITGECRHDGAETKIFGVTVTESIEVSGNTRDAAAFEPTGANGLTDNTAK